MSSTRTKTFSIADIEDLEKVDGWWAGLLRNGAKEISGLEWIARGDLTWTLKVQWGKVENGSLPFNVCMPAYSSYSLDDLTDLLHDIESERQGVLFHLKILKTKVEDWEIIELDPRDPVDDVEPTSDAESEILAYTEHLVDPGLHYGPKLDLMEKIMVSEFLWPSYKSMKRGLLMLDARAEEVKKEIDHRSDSNYTVVHVDRGMLRKSFIEQVGYDNKWLFAPDDELMDDLQDDE